MRQQWVFLKLQGWAQQVTSSPPPPPNKVNTWSRECFTKNNDWTLFWSSVSSFMLKSLCDTVFIFWLVEKKHWCVQTIDSSVEYVFNNIRAKNSKVGYNRQKKQPNPTQTKLNDLWELPSWWEAQWCFSSPGHGGQGSESNPCNFSFFTHSCNGKTLIILKILPFEKDSARVDDCH